MNTWAKVGLWCLALALILAFIPLPSDISIPSGARVKRWLGFGGGHKNIIVAEKSRSTSDVQTLYHTKGLDYPVYVPGGSYFHWKETPNEGVILFRFAKSKEGLQNAQWRRLEGEYVSLPGEIASGAVYIDFRLPEEIGADNQIEISVFPE